jgi:aspartate racemase
MKQNTAIGIIGGMGPEASEKFYGLLVRYAIKEYGISRNDEFPEIYLASIPVPDFIVNQDDMVSAKTMLIDRLEKMEHMPIGFYCMACNTGHLLLPELKKVTRKPFVSLLEELPKAINEAGITSVGLLASPTTIASGMYQEILRNHKIQTIVPDKLETRELGTIITDTIAGKNMEQNSERVQEIAKGLLTKGAEGIVEGCTEIPLLFPTQHLVPVFDTLDILARAVLKKYFC